MRATVLLVNFKDKQKLREIQMVLMTLKVKVRLVEPEEYYKTIGELVGIVETQSESDDDESIVLAKEMIVFAGLAEQQLNQVLFLMRKKVIGSVDYKAVLTDTNQSWTIPELYRELEREHKMQQTVLDLQKRFGKNMILRGTDLQEGATRVERNAQIGGHKA